MKQTKPTVELVVVKKTLSRGDKKFSAWVIDTRALPSSTLQLEGKHNDKS